MKMNTKRREIIILIIMAFVTSVICLIPQINNGLFVGDDIFAHSLRVQSLYNGFKAGQGYPLYIYQEAMEGYGYAFGLFYPDLFLLPAVLFKFLGFSTDTSMKLLVFIIMVITCLVTYAVSKYISNSRFAASVSMVLYCLGHYHLTDVIRRFALGEVIAMIFVPLVFMGLYDLTEKGYKKKGILLIAFTGLLLSHTISFVLCAILSFVWLIIRIKNMIKTPKLIAGVAIEAVICILITSYYWMPVIEQFMDSKFRVNVKHRFLTQNFTQSISDIVSGIHSVAFIEIGILCLLVFLGAYKKMVSKKSILLLICTVALIVLQTDLFPWRLIDKTVFVSIQFPWRINIFTELFLALGIGIQSDLLISHYEAQKRMQIIAIAICLAVGIVNVFTIWKVEMADYIGYIDYPDTYLENDFLTCVVGQCEWLPEEGDINDIEFGEPKYVLYEYGVLEGQKNKDGSYSFSPNGIAGKYIVPKYYYKGYSAMYIDSAGIRHELGVEKNKDVGWTEVNLTGDETKVTVYYAGTAVQRYSLLITILSLCGMVVFGIVIVRKRRLSSEIC